MIGDLRSVGTEIMDASVGKSGKERKRTKQKDRAYHHDTTIVHCEMCGQGFQGRLKMMMHRRRAHINAGEKQCPYCGGTFTNLWRHMKVSHAEDKDKKYKCDFCEKGFVDNSRLQAHLRSRHTGEKPFPCRYLCGEACAEAGNRKKHEITRHGREWSVDVVEANRSGDPDP